MEKEKFKKILPTRLFVNKLPSSQLISSSLKEKNQNEKIKKEKSILQKEESLSFLKKGINSMLKSSSSKSIIKSVEKVKNEIEENQNKTLIDNNQNKKINSLKNTLITVQTSNILPKNSNKSRNILRASLEIKNQLNKKNLDCKSLNNKSKKENKNWQVINKLSLSNFFVLEENNEEAEITSTSTTTTTTPLRESKNNLCEIHRFVAEKEGKKLENNIFGKKRIIHPKKTPSLTITRNKSQFETNINNSKTSLNKNINNNIISNYNNLNNDNNNTICNYYYNKIEEEKCEESVNIEDLIMIQEKFVLINKCFYLRNYSLLYKICFEWLNYFFNSSLKGSLNQFFIDKNIKIIIETSNTLTLITILILYDLSHKENYFENYIDLLINMFNNCNNNYLLICQSILSKIKPEYLKGNIWVDKLREITSHLLNLDSYVNQIYKNTNEIYSYITELILNIKSNYQILNYNIINIFNNYNEFSPEEIYRIFISDILKINNKEGSLLFSSLKTSNPIENNIIKSNPQKPLTLILDLDETLISFIFSNENEGISRLRPYLYYFLDLVKKYYELIIFTAATKEYADPILDVIEENKGYYFNYRLYRDSCTIVNNIFMKEISKIGRDVKKSIIVDNMAQNFKMEKENGILISSFWGEDSNDKSLFYLGKILVSVAIDMMESKFENDIRNVLIKYKDDIIKYVSMN